MRKPSAARMTMRLIDPSCRAVVGKSSFSLGWSRAQGERMRRFPRWLCTSALGALALLLGPVGPLRATPEKWEPEIAAFEQKDQSEPPAKGGIVFVGSS